MARVHNDITALKLCKEMETFRLYPVLEESEPAKRNGVYTLVVNTRGDRMRITHEEFAMYFTHEPTVIETHAPTAKKRGRPKKVKA